MIGAIFALLTLLPLSELPQCLTHLKMLESVTMHPHGGSHQHLHKNSSTSLCSSSTYGTVSSVSPVSGFHHQSRHHLLGSNTIGHHTSSAMLDHHHHASNHNKDCSLCWSSNTYAKSRTIRLRRSDQNASLGFSIRGGKFLQCKLFLISSYFSTFFKISLHFRIRFIQIHIYKHKWYFLWVCMFANLLIPFGYIFERIILHCYTVRIF